MIILTAFAIGLLSTAIRSVAGYVLAGCLIIVSFALAALISHGDVTPAALLLALLSYNAGIGANIIATRAMTLRRQA